MEIRYILLNIATIAIPMILFLIISNRVWLSCIITTVICAIIAIINHYVVLFHGMPFSFLVIKNFSTAMNVISSYKFSIDKAIVIILVALVVMVGLCLLIRPFISSCKLRGYKMWIRNIILVFFVFSTLFFGYLCSNSIKPKTTVSWLWNEGYSKYGYAVCTVESISKVIGAVNKPEGYSIDKVENIAIDEKNDTQNNPPDIVLILNESFYDLRLLTDLKTDVEFMNNIENMQNLIKGYAVAPVFGGSTNCSEYELLTSNSLQLMPGITPFNTLNLYKANSIVSVLKQQGYKTIGSHSEPKANYNRGQSYNYLGFDQVFFDNDFKNKEYYYSRWYETDSCIYKNLINWYNEMPEDSPRFLYNLTIQNHGGYDMNDSKYDIVHVVGNYGEKTNEINEYLTGVYLSDIAFKELTDYFSTVDRQVIVCMVGDHSPKTLEVIVDEKYTDEQKELMFRQVPLIIWSNKPLEEQSFGTISMNYVVPELLEIAGVKLSPYYSYMSNIKEEIPIISTLGCYYDKNGKKYPYGSDENIKYKSMIENYFFLEYNNLSDFTIQKYFDIKTMSGS